MMRNKMRTLIVSGAALGMLFLGSVFVQAVGQERVAVVGPISMGGSAVALWDNYLFVTPQASTAGRFLVYDVSNPASPVRLASTDWLDDGPFNDLEVVGNIVFAAGNGLCILNASDLYKFDEQVSSTIVGSYIKGTPVCGVTIQGRHAYVAVGCLLGSDEGLHIVDVSNVSRPQRVGFCGVGGAEKVVVQGNYAYVAAGYGGLHIIDVSNPSRPAPIGVWKPAAPVYVRDVAVAGNYAYIAAAPSGNYRGALWVIDIRIPTRPVDVFAHPTREATCVGTMGGKYVFVGTESGLYTFDISNPASSTLVRKLDVGWVWDLCVSPVQTIRFEGQYVAGHYVYITTGLGTIVVAARY